MAGFDAVLASFGGTQPSSSSTSSLGAVVSQAASQALVQRIRFRTAITPEIILEPFAPSQAKPAPSAFNPLAFLKPSFVIEGVAGAQEFSPYGKPEDYSAHAVGLLAGVIAAGSWLLGCNPTVTKYSALTAGILLVGGEALRRIQAPAALPGPAVNP